MPSLLPLSRQFYITQPYLYKVCNPVAPQPFQLHNSHSTYAEDLALTPTIMLKFGTSCGKKVRLNLDISNKADTNEVFALLDAAGAKLYNKSDRGF